MRDKLSAQDAAREVWGNPDGIPFVHGVYGGWHVGYGGMTFGGTTREQVRRYYELQGRNPHWEMAKRERQ